MPANPRIRLMRLRHDYERMCELAESSPRISFRAKGDPPEQYLVSLDCVGLEPPDWRGGEPQRRTKDVAPRLHASYPMVAPRLRQRTPIFHPNFLFLGLHRLSICIDVKNWTPQGSLADLVLRIGNLISFRSYNTYDPLDPEAADWPRPTTTSFRWTSAPGLAGSRAGSPSSTMTLGAMRRPSGQQNLRPMTTIEESKSSCSSRGEVGDE